jgi:hypothetical protein
MSILDKLKKTAITKNDSLSKEEIEFLLILIKNSHFKGENLESLYNIVYKLQQQYLNQ